MILAALALAATYHFVTPEMTLRRGLTDEQYEYFWSLGKNPQIDQTTARSWMFQSARYTNVTNWLDIVGRTNDFARLAYTLQNENFALEATNAVLVASNAVLRTELRLAVNDYEAATNLLVITDGQLTAANAKIRSEITWLTNTAVEVKTQADVCRDKDVGNWLLYDLLPAISNRIDVMNALTAPVSE